MRLTTAGPEEARASDEMTPTAHIGAGMVSWITTAGFGGIDSLLIAIDALIGTTVTSDRLCVIGNIACVDALRGDNGLRAGGYLEEHLEHADAIGSFDDGPVVVAAPRHFDNIDFRVECRKMGLLHGLGPQIAAGDVILMVEVRNPDELAEVMRHLLRYSTHQVRMRENTTKRSGS